MTLKGKNVCLRPDNEYITQQTEIEHRTFFISIALIFLYSYFGGMNRIAASLFSCLSLHDKNQPLALMPKDFKERFLEFQ